MTATTKANARAQHGPGMFEILFGALLSLGLGGALGIVCLVIRPVEKVKELPKDPVGPAIYQPVYFIAGSADSNKTPAFERQSAHGGPARHNRQPDGRRIEPVRGVDRVHRRPRRRRAAPNRRPPPSRRWRQRAGQTGGISAVEIAQLPPGSANFRIHDGALQIAVPGDLQSPGNRFPVAPANAGRICPRGQPMASPFNPDTLCVGSLPVHRLPGVSAWIFKRLLASAEQESAGRPGRPPGAG